MAASSCCAQLAQTLGGLVTFPGNASYSAAQASYWSLQESALAPACIVSPATASDVAAAVSILAGDAACPFAIRGQSHAPAAGFANIAAGVTLDMRGLSAVSVDESCAGLPAWAEGAPVARVGAGASWLDVYSYLDTHNLTVAGGRNGAVGAGGLLLGGGISYFAPRVGWACDNVVNYEIVLASGKIAQVNASSAPDLFRALKGGANNFGVVTRFDLAAFEQGAIAEGALSTPFSQRAAVYDAFAELAGAADYDEYASVVTGLTWVPGGGWQAIGTAAAYTKPQLHPKALEGLRSVPGTTGELAVTRLAPLSNENATLPLEWAFYTATYGVSAALLAKVTDVFNETVSTVEIPGLVAWSVALEPLPTAVTRWAERKGGNSLGTKPADGNGVVLLLTALWNDTSSDGLVAAAAGKMMKGANAAASEMGLLRDFEYTNYADPSQDPLAGYGEANVRWLRAASHKYDPDGVFQKQVPGGFKLGIQ